MKAAFPLWPLLAAGAVSILDQTVLLRELMASAHGTEVTLGFGLAAWVLGGAFGSAAASKIWPRAGGNKGLALCFTVVSVLALPSLAFLRGFGSLAGYLPGQGVTIGHLALMALAAMAPSGSAFGAAYVFGVRHLESLGRRRPAGSAYWAEAAGCLAAGTAFTFVLAFVLTGAGAMLAIAASSLGAASLLFRRKEARAMAVFGAALATAFLFFGERRLDLSIQAWALPGYKLESSASSPYGQTVTAVRQGQRDVFHNGYPVFHHPMLPSPEDEELPAWGLLYPDRIEDALLVGGAGMLPILLGSGADRVAYAQQDPVLAQAVSQAASVGGGSPLDRPGFEMIRTDGRIHIEDSPGGYDLIILSLPMPASLSLNRYYTREFFGSVNRALRPGGAVVLGLPGSQAAVGGIRAELAGAVLAAMTQALPRVDVIPGETVYLVGQKNMKTVPETVMANRLKARGSALNFFSESHLRHRMEEIRLRRAVVEDKLQGRGPNLDLRPNALSAGIILWQQAFSPGWAGAYSFAARQARWLWLALAVLIFWPRLRHGGTAFTAGAAAMGLQALCLWGLQTGSGALYQWMGLGNALFMAGTALGAWLHGAWPRARAARIFFWESASALWALAFLAGQAWLRIPFWGYLPCSALTGAILGLEFPSLVSGRAVEHESAESSVAGRLYSFDLAGGFFAALAAGVVLIPSWGMYQTTAFMAGLKLLSLRWWIKG